MTKIEAKIIKHSKCPRGHELVTYELVFPRFLLAELNTHRMFSKNSASSRAIPFKKMVEMVKNDPFIPIAWQKEHKGMQGSEYFQVPFTEDCILLWHEAKDKAILSAQELSSYGITKQLANRLLEPFMWHKVLLTTGKEGLQNFFELRCPQYNTPVSGKGFYAKSWKELQTWHSNRDNTELLEKANVLFKLQHNKGQAEIHMMELAESMYDTYNESVPQLLKEGEWHIPFISESNPDIWKFIYSTTKVQRDESFESDRKLLREYRETCVKISTAMCARVSYTVVGEEGKAPNYENDIKLHDILSTSGHWSPFEHCAKVMYDYDYYLYSRGKDGSASHEHGWCRNYRGFIQYRDLIENVNN